MSEHGNWLWSLGFAGSRSDDTVVQLRQEEWCVLLDPFLIWWIFHTGCKKNMACTSRQHEWSDTVQLQLWQEELCVLLILFWFDGFSALVAKKLACTSSMSDTVQLQLRQEEWRWKVSWARWRSHRFSPNLFSHNISARYFVLWILEFACHILPFAFCIGRDGTARDSYQTSLRAILQQGISYFELCNSHVKFCILHFVFCILYWARRRSPNLSKPLLKQ